MPETGLQAYREAFLLLQVLGAPEGRLRLGTANQALRTGANRRLGLARAGTANRLRDSLVPRDLTKAKEPTPKGGRAVYYRLTEEGFRRLTGMKQYPEPLLIPGRAVNRLLESVSGPASEALDTETIEVAIRDVFQELLRGRFAPTGLVPIHEVRTLLGERHGFHDRDAFDRAVLSLARSRLLALVPISDRSRTPLSHLQDAIPGVEQTLFYMKPVA